MGGESNHRSSEEKDSKVIEEKCYVVRGIQKKKKEIPSSIVSDVLNHFQN